MKTMIKNTKNTTGTISGDLAQQKRLQESETKLRLSRLGPISTFTFELGYRLIVFVPLILIAFSAKFVWVIFEDYGLLLQVIATTGSVLILFTPIIKFFGFLHDSWVDLWLPPRHESQN